VSDFIFGNGTIYSEKAAFHILRVTEIDFWGGDSNPNTFIAPHYSFTATWSTGEKNTKQWIGDTFKYPDKDAATDERTRLIAWRTEITEGKS